MYNHSSGIYVFNKKHKNVFQSKNALKNFCVFGQKRVFSRKSQTFFEQILFAKGRFGTPKSHG
jgi:hypothetical protein